MQRIEACDHELGRAPETWGLAVLPALPTGASLTPAPAAPSPQWGLLVPVQAQNQEGRRKPPSLGFGNEEPWVWILRDSSTSWPWCPLGSVISNGWHDLRRSLSSSHSGSATSGSASPNLNRKTGQSQVGCLGQACGEKRACYGQSDLVCDLDLSPYSPVTFRVTLWASVSSPANWDQQQS